MHPASDDLIVGRHVLERGLVPREKLLRCLYEMAESRRSGSAPALGSILVSRGLITGQQLIAALPRGAAGQASPAGWQFLAASAILNAEALDHCLRVQEEDRLAGRDLAPIEKVAVRLGYATEQQVERVLSASDRLLHVCRGCGNRVPLGPPVNGTRYRCRRCGGEMAPLEQVATEAETNPLVESRRPADEQLEMDRALAVFMKQRGMVRRDQLRDAERFQAECLEYGLVISMKDVLRKAGAISWQQEQELAAIDFGRLVDGAAWRKEPIRGYKLLSRLAAGGFATLYSAESIFTGARVAIKLLLGERREEERAVARFEREAGLLRKLNHPNIVRALEYGEDGGQRFLIMELVEGRSLGQTLSEGGAFPVRNALAVTRQIAEALRYLHAEGYLHRDIKPDNVLMETTGHVRLCDLGFAVEMPAPSPAGAGKAVEGGTAGYAAPEVARGEGDSTVGPDIYALGITLFSLLTGYEPFKGESSMEFVTAQFERGLPVPNLLSVKAAPGVIQLLQAMTHPVRERRLASAVEVVAAIDALLKG